MISDNTVTNGSIELKNIYDMNSIDRVLRPVSYTHLRAHETVLDLVCRLLLEKKKNNTSNNINHSMMSQ